MHAAQAVIRPEKYIPMPWLHYNGMELYMAGQ